jgi:hypothetical protein
MTCCDNGRGGGAGGLQHAPTGNDTLLTAAQYYLISITQFAQKNLLLSAKFDIE